MTARHLVADGNLALLRDVDAHEFVDAGAEFVAVLSGEYLDIDDYAALSVGNAEGGVPDLSRLLAEDCAQQSFFGGEFGLALGGDLADEDVAASHFRADAHDTVLVEVAQSVVGQVGYVAGYLLFAEFGVAGLDFVLLDVNGCEHIVAHQFLADEDGVLVVVALPAHEADEDVPAESEFALVGGGAVREHGGFGDDFAVLVTLFGIDLVALGNYGVLVYAGGLVGTLEFAEGVDIGVAVRRLDLDSVGVDILDETVALGEFYRAAVVCDSVLDARGNHRGFGLEKRNCLTLHVGAHKRAVGVVVLEEGNERRGYGDQLLGRHIHIVDFVLRLLADVASDTAHDAVADKPALVVEGFVCLRHDVFVLFVRRHIHHFVGDDTGGFVDSAVRRLDEAVFVDACVSGQRGDKTDVLTFGGLYRAHSAVVGVVNISHFEAGAFAVETAGTECRKFSLVSQFGNGVGLIHELRQLRGPEEFPYRAGDGTDVDEGLRSDFGVFLSGSHSLFDDPFQPRHADTELILQQFADGTDAPVAEVVDVVACAEAVTQSEVVTHRRHDVIESDVLADEGVGNGTRPEGDEELVAVGIFLEQALERGIIHFLADAVVAGIAVDKSREVDGVVADDFVLSLYAFLVGVGKVDDIDAAVLDFGRLLLVGSFTGVGKDFARLRIDDRFGKFPARDTGGEGKLLVVLVSADSCEVVLLVVVENAVDKDVGAFDGGHFARTESPEEVHLAGVAGLAGGVLVAGGAHHIVVAEQREQLLVGAVTESAEQGRRGDFSHSVDMHPLHIVLVLFEFQPRAPVGDDGGLIAGNAVAVEGFLAVHAGASDKLADDNALCAVDDEGPRLGHEREIAHEHFLLDELARVVVGEACLDLEGKRVGGVAVLAFLDGVLGFTRESVGKKFQLIATGVVDDRRIIGKDLAYPVADEAFVGIFLHLDKVRDSEHIFDLGKSLALGFPVHDLVDSLGHS